MSAHHDHHAHGGQEHGSLKGYAIGFVLSVILTAIPFWLVMGRVIQDSSVTAFVILGFAVLQIVVHMVCFLHMNTRAEGGWSLLALIFTIVLVLIVLTGSIWVMFHLDHNMMPSMVPAMPMSDMP